MRHAWIYAGIIAAAALTSIGHSVYWYPFTLLCALVSGGWVLFLGYWKLKAIWSQIIEIVSVAVTVVVLPTHADWILLVWLFVRASREEDGSWIVAGVSWLVDVTVNLIYGHGGIDLATDEVFYGIVLVILTLWVKERFATQNRLLELGQEREILFQRAHQTNEMLERYNQELREANMRSYETGLWNLRGFIWKASDMLGWCRKEGRSALLCVLDVYDVSTARNLAASLRLDLQKEIAYELNQLLPGALIGHLGSERFGVMFSGAVEIPQAVVDLFQTVAKKFAVQLVFGTAVFPKESGTASGILSLAEDRLRAELAEKMAKEEEVARRTDRLSAMGELAAGIAHEIRNPMTVVRGFIQLSTESWRDLVLSELDRINHLIGDFLSLARTTHSRRQVADFQATTTTACTLLEPAATLAGVELYTDLCPEPLPVLHDAEQMRQVMLNVMKNALEAISTMDARRDGESLVRHRVEVRLWRENSHAMLSVSDTGPGIPENKVDLVFNPFYSTKESGTGLGLSIAHQLVTSHHGMLTVANLPEGGAQFVIALPLSADGGVAQAQVAAGQNAQPHQPSRPN